MLHPELKDQKKPAVPVGVPVAAATPIASATPVASTTDVGAAKLLGFPRGLYAALERSVSTEFPVRFVVVDNSGSMNSGDGTRIISLADGRSMVQRCTRWQELGDEVMRLGALSEHLGARTDFHLLTPIQGRSGDTVTPERQFLTLASSWRDAVNVSCAGGKCNLEELGEVMAGSPGWSTPLTEAVDQIRKQIAPVASRLRKHGKRAVVIIATDGVPDNPHTFVQSMQHLQSLPVHLIVRLCTDQSVVVDYWSQLDKQLEAPLDQLDDVRGEAREMGWHNSWLTAGQPLHLARTFGLRHPLFDLIDERRLLPSEVKAFCELILGCKPLPEPEIDRQAFLEALKPAIADAGEIFDPRSGKMKPWVDVPALEMHLSGVPNCCVALGQVLRAFL